MRHRYASCDLLACSRPTGLFQSSVTYTTNITLHNWFYFPLQNLAILSLRVRGPWCSTYIPQLTLCWMCWIYRMIYFIHLLYFGSLIQELRSGNPWDSCWNTYIKQGCCYTYSGSWPSPDLLWIPFLPPTHSWWYPYSLLRVGIMRWSRGWTTVSKNLNGFPEQWIYCSSIL